MVGFLRFLGLVFVVVLVLGVRKRNVGCDLGENWGLGSDLLSCFCYKVEVRWANEDLFEHRSM